MLFTIAQQGHFLLTWLVLTASALSLTMLMSGLLFRRYYWAPSYERWRFKSDPRFPAPTKIRREVLQMLRGVVMATLPPAIALHLVDSGWSKAYGGLGEYGVGYLLLSAFIVWIGSDLFQWAYHYLGHRARLAWARHKHHHAFHNPSPFAVIADDALDQLVRASPMLWLPLFMPVNMDMLFLTYSAIFYAYGVYLHLGFESRWLSAHHPWINTSFQHYVHHARSTIHKPMHVGFMFKLWDQLAGSVYEAGPESCLCARCCQGRGERSREAWRAVHKPDYRPLLSLSFWLTGEQRPLELDGGERCHVGE